MSRRRVEREREREYDPRFAYDKEELKNFARRFISDLQSVEEAARGPLYLSIERAIREEEDLTDAIYDYREALICQARGMRAYWKTDVGLPTEAD